MFNRKLILNQFMSCFEKLMEILLALFILKSCLLLCLELVYIKLEAESPPTINYDNNRSVEFLVPKIEHQRSLIRDFIISSSPVRPELINSIIVANCMYLSTFLSFYYFPKLITRYYNLRREFLYCFLRNQLEGKQEVECILNKIIQMMMLSNSNYASQLVGGRIKCVTHINRRPSIGYIKYNVQQRGQPIVYNSTNLESKFYGLIDHPFNSNLDYMIRNIDQQLSTIKQEHRYYEELLVDKTKIWPQNRTEFWLKEIKWMWLQLYYLMETNVMMANFILVSLLFRGSYEFRNKQKLTQELSPLRILGYLDMFMVLPKFTQYARTISNFIISQIDLMKLVYQFRHKVAEIRLEATELILSNELWAKRAKYWMSNREHRLRCDKLCIEAYIVLRYIMIQYVPLKSNGQAIIHQIGCVILAMLVSIVSCNHKLTSYEIIFVRLIAIMMFVVVNLALGCYAELNARHLNMIKLIWSVLQATINKPNLIDGRFEDTLKRNQPKEIWINVYQPAEFKLLARYYLDHNSNFIVSPHVLYLWQRLVHHEQSQLSDLFTCKFLGLIPIDYNSLVELNFWVISVFMIYATYTDKWS